MGKPGFISQKQHDSLTNMLQSHLFTDFERESILGNIEYFTVDEATANLKWVLEQMPLRKEQESKDAAAELYQVVTFNFEELGEEQARLLYILCDDGLTPAAKFWRLKEEILEQLSESELLT